MNPHDMQVYGAVKVGERGQVVIPSDARKKLGIKQGDFLLVVSTPMKDGIALIRAEKVQEMIRKMSLGLTAVQEKKGRKRSKGRKE